MRQVPISGKTRDSTVNIVLEVLERNKQAIIFVGTKKSAERAAEIIAEELEESAELREAADKALSVLSKPTKQCERLSKCLKRSTAFHHAGLASGQKDLIEELFRKRALKVICCTPTLAFGVDLPAYRVVIRDVKRYGPHGMGFIPVLEYLQMAGRAGRPSFDKEGEAVLVADNGMEAKDLLERYVRGEPEDILSKLAVEPVLRTYVLSLIASNLVHNKEELVSFFSRTFWAYQYKDMNRLTSILDRMVGLLQKWEFIEDNDFVSASDINAYKPTVLGSRVAQLYLDPFTAHELIECVGVAAQRKTLKPIAVLHMLCSQLEMRPVSRIGTREFDDWQEQLMKESHMLLDEEPDMYEAEYDEFIAAFKTAKMLESWMEEQHEDTIMERYKATPGELHNKLQTADWLLYASCELAGLSKHHGIIKELSKTRYRLRYGVKEELLTLLRIEGIGRIRARKLFNAGIRDIGDVKKADNTLLAQLLGKALAAKIKQKVGDLPQEPVPETKRKGQLGLMKYESS